MRRTKVWPSLMAVALAAVLSGPAPAAMPVIDHAAIAQAVQQVRQGVQELRKLQEQIDQGTQLLDQGKQLYGSLNEISNVGDVGKLLNNSELRQFLPPEFSKLEGLLRSTGGDDYLGMADRAASLAEEQMVKPGDDYYHQELARIGRQAAGHESLAQRIYEAASQRQKGLEELAAKLNDPSNDARAVMDLQTRLQAEQAMIANDQMRLQGIAMLQQAQMQMNQVRAEQAQRENAHRALELARQGEEAAKTLPPRKSVFDYMGE